MKMPNQYVKGLEEHFRMRRQHPATYHDKRNRAVNECWTPSAGASKADLREYHREEMKLRKASRRKQTGTRLSTAVEEARKKGNLHLQLSNFSRTPKGKKRKTMPSASIWPEGKVAKPGRMG